MISKDKTYRTRGGKSVRIYASDAGGLFPVHGAILCDDLWIGMKWTADGHTYVGPNVHVRMDDLAEVKPRHKRTVWLHVFKNITVCASEDAYSERCDRLACIKIDLDFEEGEGLR